MKKKKIKIKITKTKTKPKSSYKMREWLIPLKNLMITNYKMKTIIIIKTKKNNLIHLLKQILLLFKNI